MKYEVRVGINEVLAFHFDNLGDAVDFVFTCVENGYRATVIPLEDEMDTWHLQVYVRSSTGIVKDANIPNGTGIIDADYYLSENGGDILLALKNNSDHTVMFGQGERVCQGIFMIHGLTEDDDADGYRTGGVGSTGR